MTTKRDTSLDVLGVLAAAVVITLAFLAISCRPNELRVMRDGELETHYHVDSNGQPHGPACIYLNGVLSRRVMHDHGYVIEDVEYWPNGQVRERTYESGFRLRTEYFDSRGNRSATPVYQE
jgi:hypothetical protein